MTKGNKKPKYIYVNGVKVEESVYDEEKFRNIGCEPEFIEEAEKLIAVAKMMGFDYIEAKRNPVRHQRATELATERSGEAPETMALIRYFEGKYEHNYPEWRCIKSAALSLRTLRHVLYAHEHNEFPY